MEEIYKYSELITKIVQRLEKIWEKKEGDLLIEIRSEEGKIKGKIKGGETERIWLDVPIRIR